jgi:molybdopterin-guanine dinucleotide biosynthesis protein A
MDLGSRSVSAIVLAGGRSERFGQDKALLPIAGRSLLARTIDVLAGLSADIQVVGRAPLPDDCTGVRVTADVVAGAGPMGGLYSGLLGARHHLVFCVGCDYPLLKQEMVELLIARASDHESAVPLVASTPHVTQAVYTRSCIPALEEHIRDSRLRLRGLLVDLSVRWVEEEELRRTDPDLSSLLNVNTTEEWERALSLMRTAGVTC